MAIEIDSKIPDSKILHFISNNKQLALLWLLLRLYVGYEWVIAGWVKITSPLWVGPQAGTAISGFLRGALEKTGGQHPDVSGWYAAFINNVALPNAEVFSYLVSFGEFLVGIALITGLLTGVAAFFGAFMNFNYMFAGTVSLNPIMLLFEIFLIAAWKTAGLIGFDKFFLKRILKALKKKK